MSVITIHAEDYIAVAVREYANRIGKSVNLAVKDLLAGAFGLGKPPKTRHELSEFGGILEKGEADEIRANMKCFNRIDKDMWK